MSTIEETILGRPAIIRANVAGVHAGIVTGFDPINNIVQVKDARRLWRVYTRDKSGSISDVAANGLKPNADHCIGAELPLVTIANREGLEIAEMTPEAWRSVSGYGLDA